VVRVRASIAGFLAVLSTGWNFANVGPAAELLRDAYGTSLGAIGLLVSALVLVHTAMNIPAGRLADALGAPRVVLAGCAVMGAANGLAALTPSLGLAFAMRLLAGLGTATAFVGAADYVRVVTRSPLAQGIVGGGALGGAGLALAVVPLLEGWGWRAPYLSSAIVAAVAGVVFLASPIRGLTPARLGAPVASMRSLVGDARLYRVGVVHVFSMGTSVVVGTWVVTLLGREAGYGTREAGLVGSLVLLIGVVTRPAGGWVRHRYASRLRQVLQASLVVGGLGTVVLATAPPLPLAIVCCSVIGVAAGLPFAAAFDAAASLRPDAPAAAVGLVNMLANLFVLAVTPVVGVLLGLASGGRLAFVAVGVVWALAAFAVPSARGLGLEQGGGPFAAAAGESRRGRSL
jgi:MFS family permease